jgi:hypothetical protein
MWFAAPPAVVKHAPAMNWPPNKDVAHSQVVVYDTVVDRN